MKPKRKSLALLLAERSGVAYPTPELLKEYKRDVDLIIRAYERSQWNPVSERPDLFHWVLVWCKGHYAPVRMGRWDGVRFHDKHFQTIKVTHWMEMPKGPSK